jgi:hypothetical protein
MLFGLSLLRSLATHAEPYLITVMSERDQARKMGGTRDTVGLWPNAQRHITINPDVYVPVVPTSEDSTPTTTPQANRTDRPVLYFVCFDLPGDDPSGETVFAHLADASLPVAVTWRKDNEVVAGFKQLLGAMEFTSHILSTASPVHPAPRITLHAGPFPLTRATDMQDYPRTQQGVESPVAAIEQVKGVHHLTPVGSVYASGTLGALLALDTARYKLSFVDIMRASEGQSIRPIDVFSVAMLHISKHANR